MSFLSDFGGYTTVSINNRVLFIGGFCDISFKGKPGDGPSNWIIRYEIDEWTQIGKLLTSRLTHNAIVNGDRIFVIGGIDPLDFGSRSRLLSPNAT